MSRASKLLLIILALVVVFVGYREYMARRNLEAERDRRQELEEKLRKQRQDLEGFGLAALRQQEKRVQDLKIQLGALTRRTEILEQNLQNGTHSSPTVLRELKLDFDQRQAEIKELQEKLHFQKKQDDSARQRLKDESQSERAQYQSYLLEFKARVAAQGRIVNQLAQQYAQAHTAHSPSAANLKVELDQARAQLKDLQTRYEVAKNNTQGVNANLQAATDVQKGQFQEVEGDIGARIKRENAELAAIKQQLESLKAQNTNSRRKQEILQTEVDRDHNEMIALKNLLFHEEEVLKKLHSTQP